MKTNGPALVVPGATTPAPPQEMHGVRPPVAIPDYWLWLWIFLAVVVLAAGVYFLWKFWRKRSALQPPPEIIPPHLRARRRLEEALRLIDDPKPFTIEVSDAIRQYLEGRFHFHAPERTTEEFLRELGETTLLTPDQKQSLTEFLNQCDLVKFARYEPIIVELQGIHQSAVRLVSETEPSPMESEPAASLPTT